MTMEMKKSETTKPGRLPAPPEYVIRKMTKERLAEQIETYMCFIDKDGYPAHLQDHFVRHYYQYRESKVGRIRAVSPLPLMRDDGSLLGLENQWNTNEWFDRASGIAFFIPAELRRFLMEAIVPPANEDVALGMAADAMHYLSDVWLVDVTTNYAGKCVAVAMALSVIERVLFDERPCFLVTAGRRGGGKTTLLNMISAAVTGHKAVARAWSPSHEEQRKAQLAYLREGRPMLVWDNIPRGSVISSAALARALTSPFYSDRELGESRAHVAPAFTIQALNGNNIRTAGDLTSRRLEMRLEADRPDPENREFVRKEDPVEWTLSWRHEVLQAMYTLLIVNPRRRQKPERRSPAPTRFKAWWDFVGSAVEFAAEQHEHYADMVGFRENCMSEKVSFRQMFEAGEREDEQNDARGQLLVMLRQQWPGEFTARDVALFAQDPESKRAAELRELLDTAAEVQRYMRKAEAASKQAVAKRLLAIVGNPVVVGSEQLCLRYHPDPAQAGVYLVESKPAASG
jgi:hypothetical protein